MKNRILLTIIVILFGSVPCNAQLFGIDIPVSTQFDSTYVLGQGMTDTFDISTRMQGFSQGQFYLCNNATLYFKGNQSSTMPDFFLTAGSKLVLLDSYLYPTVHMQGNCELDAQGGNQNITLHRDSSGLLTDTANVNWLSHNVYGGVGYTYNNWPNSSDPCSLSPSASGDYDKLKAKIHVQNNLLIYELIHLKKATLEIYGMSGKLLLSQSISANGKINMSELASGFYMIVLHDKGLSFRQKVFIP